MRYFLLTGVERSSSGKNETTRGNTGHETKGKHNIHFKNVCVGKLCVVSS